MPLEGKCGAEGGGGGLEQGGGIEMCGSVERSCRRPVLKRHSSIVVAVQKVLEDVERLLWCTALDPRRVHICLDGLYVPTLVRPGHRSRVLLLPHVAAFPRHLPRLHRDSADLSPPSMRPAAQGRILDADDYGCHVCEAKKVQHTCLGFVPDGTNLAAI